MADIPGIIEGASEGKGLGLRFLRHIERNSLLLFIVPGDTDDIRKEYEILLNELATFNPEMLDKQRVLAITKSDMLDEELIAMLEPTLPDNVPHIFISGLGELLINLGGSSSYGPPSGVPMLAQEYTTIISINKAGNLCFFQFMFLLVQA